MMSSGFIGVLCHESEKVWAEEFFELFKTPWEFYCSEHKYSVILSTDAQPGQLDCELLIIYSSAPQGEAAAVFEATGEPLFIDSPDVTLPLYGKAAAFSWGLPLAQRSGSSDAVVVETATSPGKVIRAGYDLFGEVAHLLSKGQPADQALIPTLDIHISMLSRWISRAGIPFVEIPSSPPGYNFTACLTHDVDFVRISDHKFDHTMLGFIQRASVGSLRNVVNGRISPSQCLQNFKALISLPAVCLGLRKDFWFQDFDRFLELEHDTKSTFFFIPYKNRPGEKVGRPHSRRRGAAYDVTNERGLIEKLMRAGNEIGVHGIDAWHNAKKGREERLRIAEVSNSRAPGVRMHWLCFDAASPRVLEEAGFRYDSTVGYNDAVGYRAGTQQVFRPQGAKTLLELPLHIQDSALFQAGGLASTEPRAWKSCETILDNADNYGGAVTILWHTRSLAPERLWGGFYVRLLDRLKSRRVWFATAGQIVDWFRSRRAVSFQRAESSGTHGRIAISQGGGSTNANMAFRIHAPHGGVRDIPWRGEQSVDLAMRR